ncbi:MAG: hypothetical protein C0501_31645 [Isosphaera sp.]|nr:hypothetical protein [Isosphaera sp.]
MRHPVLSGLLLSAALGCAKKPPPTPPAPEPAPDDPADATARDRAYWLKALRTGNPAARQEAADELAVWVETDPPTVPAVLELLKDRSTSGAGKILPARVNSAREGAALALSRGGPKGEAALKERGLAILRDGLTDADPAVREHTAHTLGRLGPLARPVAADIQTLCTDKSPAVRSAAFAALREVGGADPVALADLVAGDDPAAAWSAAALIAAGDPVPDTAVPKLAAGLANEDPRVRAAVAAALATAGPRAAAAAGPLADAVKAVPAYRGKYDPESHYRMGAEEAYWVALTRIGGPAVPAVAGLLGHENALVRRFAAEALGAIGPPAKPAAAALKGLLADEHGFVALEAACALCRVGDGTADAVGYVRRLIDAPDAAAQAGIEAIPRMGEAGKPLVPVALGKLGGDNPHARFAAAGLVGVLPVEEGAKHAAALGKLATDAERDIRLRAGQVLEKLGPAGGAAAAALAAAVPKEADPAARDQFVDALIAMGPAARPGIAVLLPVVADRTASGDRRLRAIAAVAAADPGSKEVSAALLGAAAAPEAWVRGAAAAALVTLDPVPPEALAAVVAMANTDKATEARVAALRALAAAGPKAKPVRAEVEKIAGGKYPEFALPAKVALAAMDGDVGKAAADVRSGLGDKNGQVRAAAAASLVLVGPAAADLPGLQKLLRDPAADTRAAAAACIGRLGPAGKEAVPGLVRLLDDKEGAVRAAAAAALGEVGPAAREAVGKLRELRGDPQAGRAAVKALEKLGVPE